MDNREIVNHLMISLLQGATMPAAHMLAMTWFKSTHRSWYFSCYAGKFLLILISRSRYIYIIIYLDINKYYVY